MTNAKLIETYDEFLTEVVGCKADENGNRPCDYGTVCDKCMSENFQEMWRKCLTKRLVCATIDLYQKGKEKK